MAQHGWWVLQLDHRALLGEDTSVSKKAAICAFKLVTKGKRWDPLANKIKAAVDKIKAAVDKNEPADENEPADKDSVEITWETGNGDETKSRKFPLHKVLAHVNISEFTDDQVDDFGNDDNDSGVFLDIPCSGDWVDEIKRHLMPES